MLDNIAFYQLYANLEKVFQAFPKGVQLDSTLPHGAERLNPSVVHIQHLEICSLKFCDFRLFGLKSVYR